MYIENHSPQLTPNEQQTDELEKVDVVPEPEPESGPLQAPIATAGHYEMPRSKLAEVATFPLVWVMNLTWAKVLLMILPVTILVAGLIIGATAPYTSSTVVPRMAEAICAIPLVSAVPPCSRFIQSKPTMQELPFTKLMEVQKRLLPIMEAAGSGTNLALDFKRVEMKISDLNTLVQLSDLENKSKLSASLYEFEASAAKASYHLSRMESNVEGAVSAILVTDDYVIQSLETIAHQEQQKSIITSIISPFVANPASQDSLIQTFNHMADVMETELQDLACSVILFPDKPLTHLQIESTVAATGILGQLQVNIKEIHHLVSKAQGKTEGDLERTLADLWTMVGGNRAKLARFAGHHSLLSQIGNYHSTATEKVGQALVKLYRLGHDLNRLRTRVAAPILPNEPTIPLELHIKSLRKGVEVLTEGKYKAKEKEDRVIEQIGNKRKYVRLEST